MVSIFFNENVYLPKINPNDKIENHKVEYYLNIYDYPIVHTHEDYWEFTIVIDGELENICNGKKQIIRKNEMFVATTDDVHCVKRHTAQKIEYLNIPVRESYLLEVFNVVSPGLAEKIRTGNKTYLVSDSFIYAAKMAVHKLNLLTTDQYEIYHDLLTSIFLSILQIVQAQSIKPSKTSNAFVVDILKISEREDFLSFNVSDLCNSLNYSKAQLDRVFAKELNTTPHKYILNFRLQYAANLLKTTNMRVLDIAIKVGYANISQFNNNFKEKYGLTPGLYRKQL